MSRITEQPGFVLHSMPYRETSLIIDAFSRDYGRLTLIAKGAKRPHSALRVVLQSLQPLSLSWTGKSEIRTLTRADWVGGMMPLSGNALLCGFYVNELLIRLCAREDPHERLFDHYTLTLTRLASASAHSDSSMPALRSFERVLLRETGHASAFDRIADTDQLVVAEEEYVFDPKHGVRNAYTAHLRHSPNALARWPAHWPIVSGQTLIDMAADNYERALTVAQSKRLMRFLLHHYLAGAPLNTRQILIDLQNL